MCKEFFPQKYFAFDLKDVLFRKYICQIYKLQNEMFFKKSLSLLTDSLTDLQTYGQSDFMRSSAALCNHDRIVFQKMSSWTALTMHLWVEDNFLD